MKPLCLCMGLWLTALCTQAQQLSFYSINEKDNLPSNEVYQVLQGNDGYVYIGCSTGLFSYDGYSFNPIKGKGQNAKSISHLVKDASGKIWCQNFAGQLYFVRNDSLILFRDFSDENLSIPQFAIDGNEVWLALPQKLLQIKSSGEEVSFAYPDSSNWNATSLAINKGDAYLTEADKGFFKFNIDSAQFKPIGTFPPQYSTRCISNSEGDNVFIFCDLFYTNNFSIMWISNGKVTNQRLLQGQVMANENYFFRKISNGAWLCTSNGAYYFSGNDFSTYEHHLFAGQNVSHVSVDHEGNLWFTTLGNGIHIVPSAQFMIIQEPGAQSTQHVTSFHTTSTHEKYFGTITGDVYKINSHNQSVKLQSGVSNLYRRVTGILSYKENLIVARGLLSIFDKNLNEKVYSVPYIRDIVILDSLLYIASSGEFGVFNLDTKQYTTIRANPVRKITGNARTKEIALTGNTGVEIYYKGKFRFIEDDGTKINATAVRFTYSTLWIGTMNGEVLGIDKDEITTRITSPEFRGSTVSAMFSKHDDLIFTTEAGLHWLDLYNDSLRFFGKRLLADFQGVNTIWLDQDTIYLATQRGLYLFPKKIVSNQNSPLAISITGILVDGNVQQPAPGFTVRYDESLRINFKSISFTSPKAVSYSYRLKDVTNGWHDLKGIQDHVIFESLNSGEYTFEVRAIDSDGIASLTPAVLHFTITTPFWKQGWFIFLLFITVIICSLLLGKRLRSLR